MKKQLQNWADIFGLPIYTYTRRQALADGSQVDVSATAKEQGFCWPVFITRAAWDLCVRVSPGVDPQNEPARLWFMLWLVRHQMVNCRGPEERLPFELSVETGTGRGTVKLAAVAGALDVDNGEPSITVMLATED